MLDLLLTLTLSAPTPFAPPAAAPAPPCLRADGLQEDDPREEFDRRYKAARGDEDELWKLYEWTETFALEREGRRVLRALIKLDEDNARARELLGHVEYDGEWYDSQAKADAAREKAEAKAAKAKGWVKFEGRWVDPADVPYLERGLIKTDSGRWIDPEEQRRLDEGWVQQDLTWIPPDEIEKLRAGLWKVGDEWLSLEDANKAHSKLFQWWRIPGDRFELWTTCEREVAERISRELGRTYSDLQRFFGRQPAAPPVVVVLRSTDQYNALAGGEDGVRDATEVLGWSSVHGAYFADAFYSDEQEFVGAAVAYYDAATDATAAFGRHYVRHAAGLSFAEAVDPSPEFLAKVAKNPRLLERGMDDFYEEKRVPMVLRYGAAAWVERYFVDTTVPVGGDSHWASKWSVQNITRRGGLDPIDRILEFRLSADDPDGGAKLINQAGLLVSFIMSGRNEVVLEAHKAWRDALVAGEKLEKPTEALFDALRQEEAALRQYADEIGG